MISFIILFLYFWFINLFYFFIHCWFCILNIILKEFGNLVEWLNLQVNSKGGGIGKIINKFKNFWGFFSLPPPWNSFVFAHTFWVTKDAFRMSIFMANTYRRKKILNVSLSSKYFGTTCWIDKFVKFLTFNSHKFIFISAFETGKIHNNLENFTNWRYKVIVIYRTL